MVAKADGPVQHRLEDAELAGVRLEDRGHGAARNGSGMMSTAVTPGLSVTLDSSVSRAKVSSPLRSA